MRLLYHIACGLLLPFLSTAHTVNLGTAASFAVLAGSKITNTGVTVLTGDLGVSPGSAITVNSSVIVVGAKHWNDTVAAQAQSDLTIAFNTAASLAPTQNLTGRDLGGLTLTSGVYSFRTSAQLTGNLTLNAQGMNEAQFVFQVGSTLATANDSSVVIINGTQPCNIFWQIGSSAMLGARTNFKGAIMALESITANTGARDIGGALLARNGQVSLDTNKINVVNACGTRTNSTTTSRTTTTSCSTATDTPTTTITSFRTVTRTVTKTPPTASGISKATTRTSTTSTNTYTTVTTTSAAATKTSTTATETSKTTTKTPTIAAEISKATTETSKTIIETSMASISTTAADTTFKASKSTTTTL